MLIRLLSWHLSRNYISNVIKVKLDPKAPLKPLIFEYHVTSVCNFNCVYCNYVKNGKTKDFLNQLNTEDVFKLLAIIRKVSPNIHFTGGEPLMRGDFVEILKEAKRLNFKIISVVSNMSLIHNKMEVLDYLTNLTMSLDMLDMERYSKTIGVPVLVAEKLKTNIITCSKLQKKKDFTMFINLVATKETIPHAKEVIDFCLANKIRFTLGPSTDEDGSVDKELIDNKEYHDLLDYILKLKNKTNLIFGSKHYYKIINRFDKFNCHPTLLPRVFPKGELIYPCEVLNKDDDSINLLEEGDYMKALSKAMEKYGQLPQCQNKCYMNCYVEPSSLIEKPLSSLKHYL